ncbi:unnamed protein product [Rotaria sordida]|uniref:RING-type domain-containing protein n=1 Tax=Rotaria sordida TaxID=392033 RepID=A0A815MB83_9BILA|nr:unnamed protein product [Rotaria sordida]CAF1407684.1 unnamed protein product [Rotaria sordida]CAF1419241.1 unnamed protein product [Rotaria sordida]CAF1571944.1 unnamed protein product [Rotaria sordida]CAF3967038.1 unnamed protein product [Rotaria sordida]
MTNKQQAEIRSLHTLATPWRIIDPGLWLEGRCLTTNGRCSVHKEMVIGNLEMGEFTISRMYTFKCPICENSVRAERFGLNRCQWRIMNTSRWTNVTDMYQIYNLNRLPIHIETRSLNKDIEFQSECSICLSSMDQKSTCSILPCQHIFHTECIHGWIDSEGQTSLQCPMCRKPIFE